MKRHLLTWLVLLLAALALPAAALAKGAESATLSGSGLKKAGILIKGNGEPGSGTPLGQLAEESGFFPEVFGQSPDPLLKTAPKGDLGPSYTLSYVMPGPNGVKSTIVQTVYPYAKPDPLTYVKPGQTFFDGQKTLGGWFQTPVRLKQDLVSIGLPATAPGGGGFGIDLTTIGMAAALAAALALSAIMALRFRRRPRPLPTT